MAKVRFVGLGIPAETIAVAVAEPDGEVRSLEVVPNRPESIRKLIQRLQPVDQVRACYEELSGKQDFPAYQMGLVHVGLGQKDEALAMLEKAFASDCDPPLRRICDAS